MSESTVKCQRIEVGGIVQGVGFRPFVYRTACSLGLKGWVENTVHGVRIEVRGESAALDRFSGIMRNGAPPMARVLSVRRKLVKAPAYKKFEIRPSVSSQGRSTLICPDASICDDCLSELRDPGDRRYRYPFINCTNCGPRYTIILDLPYDRARTTMASFTMCPDCMAEFENPLDRRFHAQPNACPVCGPQVKLVDAGGRELSGPRAGPIEAAARWLLDGRVLAVKGLGGFHLAVDAANEQAARRLRDRKQRQDKPFAVMFAGLESVREHCRINSAAARALASPARPIVLLPKRSRQGSSLARPVAPYQDTYGVMLPYTPLHYLLLDAVGGRPLVMTSGNSSDEPVEIDNESALRRLAHIADAFLVHDRPIYMRCDDSVIRSTTRAGLIPVRRSRGYVPQPVFLREKLPPVLAAGAHLKNTLCLIRGSQAFLSQHVGDLDSTETMAFYCLSAEQLQGLLEVKPVIVAHDLHPDYLSTRWALEQAGLPAVAVQHHHAHVVSCMAEHGLSGKVLGIAMDGTGYGGDGTVWGSEFLVADEAAFERAGHLPYWPMPGGEAAVKEPWRMARSVFGAVLGTERLDSLGHPIWERAGLTRVKLVDRMLERQLNCPVSSGCGRLFDAVAALAGLRDYTLYEGQPAMELESLARRAGFGRGPCYPFELTEAGGSENVGVIVPELGPMLEAIAADCASEVDPGLIAAGFHNALSQVIVELGVLLAGARSLSRVVLTGGVFNNSYLLESVGKGLRKRGLRVYSHRRVPPGDGGISLGQAVVAARTLKK